VRKFLIDPDPKRPPSGGRSKLGPFQRGDQQAPCHRRKPRPPVILQRIAPLALTEASHPQGLPAHPSRPLPENKEAFIRFESLPGEQCQVDWGHFGSIAYRGDNTQALLPSRPGMPQPSSLSGVHSFSAAGNPPPLSSQCLLRFFNGTPKELVTDNMFDSSSSNESSPHRFNEAFLDFLRPLCDCPQGLQPKALTKRVKWKR